MKFFISLLFVVLSLSVFASSYYAKLLQEAALKNNFQQINEITKKESNRIEEMRKILVQAGIKCKSTKDSMTIFGEKKIDNKNKYILIKTPGDHRISLSACIFSLVTGIKTKIQNFDTVNTSFPGFIPLVRSLGGKVDIV